MDDHFNSIALGMTCSLSFVLNLPMRAIIFILWRRSEQYAPKWEAHSSYKWFLSHVLKVWQNFAQQHSADLGAYLQLAISINAILIGDDTVSQHLCHLFRNKNLIPALLLVSEQQCFIWRKFLNKFSIVLNLLKCIVSKLRWHMQSKSRDSQMACRSKMSFAVAAIFHPDALSDARVQDWCLRCRAPLIEVPGERCGWRHTSLSHICLALCWCQTHSSSHCRMPWEAFATCQTSAATCTNSQWKHLSTSFLQMATL